jgi:putative heme-binding domain-containing protein
MRRIVRLVRPRTLVGAVALLAAAPTLLQGAPTQQAAETTLPTDPMELARGERTFTAQCSRCHGVGGTGGEGPALNRPTLRSAPDDDALMAVISDGIPGTDMGGSWSMSEQDVRQVAAYIRTLGRTEVAELPGDSARGAAMFMGDADCTACHIVSGVGTGIGPELTDIGARRGVQHLREALLEPGTRRPSAINTMGSGGFDGYLLVRAVLPDGRRVEGMRINEDDFTLQLRDDLGRSYSLRKDELREVQRLFDSSAMPSYEGVFTESELDDLVAYLASLRGNP